MAQGLGVGGSEWESSRTEHRGKAGLGLLNRFCLCCKLVAIEPNETCGYILWALHVLLKLFGISCQHLSTVSEFHLKPGFLAFLEKKSKDLSYFY